MEGMEGEEEETPCETRSKLRAVWDSWKDPDLLSQDAALSVDAAAHHGDARPTAAAAVARRSSMRWMRRAARRCSRWSSRRRQSRTRSPTNKSRSRATITD